jgi:hypothetical protein
VAGGYPSDLITSKDHKFGAGAFKDIDIFVPYNPDIPKILEENGFVPFGEQEVNCDNYVNWGNKFSLYYRHPKLSSTVNIVGIDDSFSKTLSQFDLKNRLSYFDGVNVYATEDCIAAIAEKTLKLNYLNTPERTSIRLFDFKRRYGWEIADWTRYKIRLTFCNDYYVMCKQLDRFRKSLPENTTIEEIASEFWH